MKLKAQLVFLILTLVAKAKAEQLSDSSSDDSNNEVTVGVIMWDLGMGIAMCIIALVGALGLFIPPKHIKTFTRPLIAFAAGALIGGAFFHMLPSAVNTLGTDLTPFSVTVLGFVLFLAIEECIHWIYNRQPPNADESCEATAGNINLPESALMGDKTPIPCKELRACNTGEDCACPSHHLDRGRLALAWLILVGDGLHNFFGGLSIGATYMTSASSGWAAWCAAALHELPQELGDFAVLVHAGLNAKKALLYNFLSALPFLFGTLLSAAIGSTICKYFIPFVSYYFLYF
jgi:zinc and cadmium transporter